MPLNYSKWDNIELSDDDTIEGHPNIDHASLVRWKQQAIHQEREETNIKIQNWKMEIEMNKKLIHKMKQVTNKQQKTIILHTQRNKQE